MVTSGERRPADVIALSPFRAELGRGRRLRRADALYDAPELGPAVRALPGDELYYVLHEVGLREGAELLAEATAEQLQVVLDFAIWERDRIDDEALTEWLEAMAGAPVERIGEWLTGIDSEILGLVLRRRARIYDLSQEPAPEEPEGTVFPTPDRLFVLDVRGGGGTGEGPEPAAVIVRLVDAFYRADATAARRMLVAARGELDAELEEGAYRWRQARMADLGFSDYYEALEVYRELDKIDLGTADRAPEPSGDGDGLIGAKGELGDDALRVPTALAERLRDTDGSPFARAAQKLGDGKAVEELRHALITLTNQVLAADRVEPGDDDAVAAVLARMAATLDVAIERLAAGDDARGGEVLRAVPLGRLFRFGYTLTVRVRRLALALRHEGPLGRAGYARAEADDAAVLEAVTRARPTFPRLLDTPPAGGERPFATLADVALAAAAVERAGAAQALLRGLGVRERDLVPGAPPLADAADDAAIDIGVLARTVLLARLAEGTTHAAGVATLAPLDAREVAAFESGLRPAPGGAPPLPAPLAARARAALEAAAPRSVSAAAAGAVIDRWLASLAPLEPVLVRAPRPSSARVPTLLAEPKRPPIPATKTRADKKKAKPKNAKPKRAKAKRAKAKAKAKAKTPKSKRKTGKKPARAGHRSPARGRPAKR